MILWIRENYALVASILLVGGVLYAVGTSFGGLSPEQVAALLAVALVSIGASARLLTQLLVRCASPSEGLVALLVGASTLGLSLIPAFQTLVPGDPLAVAEVAKCGETIELPAQTKGAIRLLVHGDIGGKADHPAKIDFTFDGAQETMHGRLQRVTSTTRLGKRGRRKVTNDQNWEFVSGILAAERHELTLAELKGPLLGRLEVRVFDDYWDFRWHLLLVAFTLIVVGALTARLDAGRRATALAGFVLAFGLAMHGFATPANSLRSTIGAVIIGGLVGVTVGSLLGWLLRKCIPPHQGPPWLRV